MYNENLKRQFIKSYAKTETVVKICESVFKAFEESENKHGADLCTMSTEELQPIISTIVGFRVRSKWVRLIILKDYVRWCIGMGVKDARGDMLSITNVGLEKVKLQTVPNPRSLQNYLNVICAPEDDKTIDNIYRCYYWLAYAGMDEEDIMEVKSADVDFKNMVVNYHKKSTTVPIYPEAVKAIRYCSELESFQFIHPNYSEAKWRPRVSGSLLMRGVKTNGSLKSVRVEMSKRAKEQEDKTQFKLSYFRVWISGVFYRAHEGEIAGEEASFSDIAANQMEGKTYKLDSGRNTIAAKHRQLTRDYEEDYERWKLAWY